MTYDTDPPPIDQNSAEVGLGALYTYVFFAYPYFAKELGGGNKPVVRILLSPSATFSGSELELPIMGNSGTVGPVTLVFESENMFFVKPFNSSETGWEKLLGSRRPVVGVAKSSVSAIVYVQD